MQARFALHHSKMANLKRELFSDITLKGVVGKTSVRSKKTSEKTTLNPLSDKRAKPRFSVVDARLTADSALLEQQMIRQQLSLYPSSLSVEPKR
jgi:hypothetical protein